VAAVLIGTAAAANEKGARRRLRRARTPARNCGRNLPPVISRHKRKGPVVPGPRLAPPGRLWPRRAQQCQRSPWEVSGRPIPRNKRYGYRVACVCAVPDSALCSTLHWPASPKAMPFSSEVSTGGHGGADAEATFGHRIAMYAAVHIVKRGISSMSVASNRFAVSTPASVRSQQSATESAAGRAVAS
jgi:hypothetical protein